MCEGNTNTMIHAENHRIPEESPAAAKLPEREYLESLKDAPSGPPEQDCCDKLAESYQSMASTDSTEVGEDRNSSPPAEDIPLIDQIFPPCRRSVANFCTFGSPNSKLCLKEKHIRKVSKYARRRFDKMNWDVLEEDQPRNLPRKETHAQVKLGDVLGEGSFSCVFTKKDDEEQVVKVLRKKLIHNPAMLAACAADLVKEGLLLSVLSEESNIVKIHGWQQNGLHTLVNGFHDGFFLVLEKLDLTLSQKLKEWQKKKNKLSNPFSLRKKGGMTSGQAKLLLLEERIEVIPQLARGIANMHKHGIIHRDLKPDNIGYSNGQWKLFDLDVARLTPTYSPENYCSLDYALTKRVGSPRYMSPECARGDNYNCLSDVYSFGLLVHELLTLEKPYDNIPAEFHDELIFYQHRRPDMSSSWPISLKYFLDSSWHKDWKQRPVLLEESVHASLCDRILPEFVDYKRSQYTPTKRSSGGFFGGKNKQSSVIPKNAVKDLETSFQTQMTTSLRTDSRDVSPVQSQYCS